MKPLFVREGEHYHPSETAASPWGPMTLHGGASTALMVSAMEERFSATDMQLARLTVDLFRSVPMAPLWIECKTIRDGRRVKVFDVSLYSDDVEVCRASGLILLKDAIEVPDYANNDLALPDAIDKARHQEPHIGVGETMRMRKAANTPGLHRVIPLKPVFLNIGVGHGCSWLKLPVAVIEGRDNSPLLSVAALADFANGFSQVHLNEEVGFINADLSVNLFRMPESEWLCIDSRAFPQSTGLSMVETVLYDERGMIGRVSQSNLTLPRLKA